MASPPPRPKKEERRREKSARSTRPGSLALPSTQGLLLVLGGVVAIVVSFSVGYWRGNRRAEAPAGIMTKAIDPLAEVDDEPAPPKAVGGAASPEVERKTPRYGVQIVSYDRGTKNEELAKRTRDELQKSGLPNVVAWQEPEARGGDYFLTVGSFASKGDAGLLDLLDRVKKMDFGREKAPFANARVRELQ